MGKKIIQGRLEIDGDLMVTGTITGSSSSSAGSHVWRCSHNHTLNGSPLCYYADITSFDRAAAKVGDVIIDADGTIAEIQAFFDDEMSQYCTIKVISDGATSGTTIWEAPSADMTGANNTTSPLYDISVLTPIAGKTPQVNDYIADSIGNLVRIYYVGDTTMYVECVIENADDQYIWDTDEDLTQIGISFSPQVSFDILKPATETNRIPRKDDYIVDSVGNICRIFGSNQGTRQIVAEKIVSSKIPPKEPAKTAQFNLTDDGVLFVEMVIKDTNVYVVVYDIWSDPDEHGNYPIYETYYYPNIPEGITWKELLTNEKYNQPVNCASNCPLWYDENEDTIWSGSYASVNVSPDEIVIPGNTYYADGN